MINLFVRSIATLTLTLTLFRSGLTNAFADREGSWYCVSLQDIIDAEPDVFVIVDASGERFFCQRTELLRLRLRWLRRLLEERGR